MNLSKKTKIKKHQKHPKRRNVQSSEEESSSYDIEQIDDNQGNSVSPTLGLVDEDDFHEPYKKKRRN